MNIFIQRFPHSRSLLSMSWLLISIIGTLLASYATMLIMPNNTAFAHATVLLPSTEGPGEVCVFFAPKGASLVNGAIVLGHVGWGFRVGQQDHWVFGATENGDGALTVNAGGYNGAWVSSGNNELMMHDFAYALPDNGEKQHPYYHSDNFYQQYRCKSTTTTDTLIATKVALGVKQQGYGSNSTTLTLLLTSASPLAPILAVPFNDCESDTIQVLTAYNSHVFDSQKSTMVTIPTKGGISQQRLFASDNSDIPTQWFNSLDIDGFGAINPIPH